MDSAQTAWAVAKRQTLYNEGVVADGIFHLCSGSVKLASRSNGTSRMIAVIKPGEWFGLDSPLPQPRRMFTAIAREASTICHLERDQLLGLLKRNGDFLKHLVETLTVALHESQRSAVLFSGNGAKRNLLNAIAYCVDRSITLKHVELAELLGISPETVSRELPRFSDLGKADVSIPKKHKRNPA